MGNNKYCRGNKWNQVPKKTLNTWLEMGTLSTKQADKLNYMEYLIKDKQTLYVFFTVEDIPFQENRLNSGLKQWSFYYRLSSKVL